VELIIRDARDWLAPSGVLVLEHGAAQRSVVLDACERAGYDEYHDVNDLAGHARILVARR
jgi:methylase of polypeptide subunit release factors